MVTASRHYHFTLLVSWFPLMLPPSLFSIDNQNVLLKSKLLLCSETFSGSPSWVTASLHSGPHNLPSHYLSSSSTPSPPLVSWLWLKCDRLVSLKPVAPSAWNAEIHLTCSSFPFKSLFKHHRLNHNHPDHLIAYCEHVHMLTLYAHLALFFSEALTTSQYSIKFL